ncbi:thymidylate kinase [Treponema sp. R8-4-B8]
MNYRFIVIEGLDGCGKSTQINLLRKYLNKENIKSVFFHYPRIDSKPYGYLISKFLRGEFGSIETVDPYLISVLFAGDRKDNDTNLRRFIDNNYFIICDRYLYSNIAFQCAKLTQPNQKNQLKKWILEFEYGYNKILRPSLSIYLNLPFRFIKNNLSKKRTGEDRYYLKGKNDIHEKDLTLQKKVHFEYKKLISKEKDIIMLDCFYGNEILSPEAINKKIIDLLYKKRLIKKPMNKVEIKNKFL